MVMTTTRVADFNDEELLTYVSGFARGAGIQRFELTNVTSTCREVAEQYTSRYARDFSYMLDMKRALARWGHLTPAQAKGVLNCMMSDIRRAQAQTELPGVTEDGMYRIPETGEIFKVQFNRASGDGRRLYAKELVVEQEAEWIGDTLMTPAKIKFEYVAGAVRWLTPDMKMTLAEAEEWGALYGTCIRCGRTLTREESIARSMGPVCVRYFRS